MTPIGGHDEGPVFDEFGGPDSSFVALVRASLDDSPDTDLAKTDPVVQIIANRRRRGLACLDRHFGKRDSRRIQMPGPRSVEASISAPECADCPLGRSRDEESLCLLQTFGVPDLQPHDS